MDEKTTTTKAPATPSAPQAGTKPSPSTQTTQSALPPESDRERIERLLAKVKVLRERATTHRNSVKGDPSKDYVWVHSSDHMIVTFEALGYRICLDPNIKTPWKKEDGRHVRGDVVLMEVDKELREAFKLEAEARSVEQLEGSRESFLAFAAARGVPAFDNSRRE